MNSNSLAGVLGFWMLLQLVVTLALLLGGIYALFCLGRAASGLDRMASALEEWLARQSANAPALPDSTNSSGALSFSQRINSTAPVSSDALAPAANTPAVQAQSFTPAAPSIPAAPSNPGASPAETSTPQNLP